MAGTYYERRFEAFKKIQQDIDNTKKLLNKVVDSRTRLMKKHREEIKPLNSKLKSYREKIIKLNDELLSSIKKA